MHGSCFEIGQRSYPVGKRSLFSWFDLGYKTDCKKLLKKAKIDVGEIALNSILFC